MRRHLIIGSWLLVAAAACDKSAQDEQAKADQAQRAANEQSSNAARIAEQKGAQAQAEADDKSARANEQAAREGAKAQANANETIRNVHQDLLKDRNDFQVDVNKTVDGLDSRIDQLKVKSQKATPKVRADFDAAMKDVDAKRTVVGSDLGRLESQTAESFDGFKVRMNKEIDDLKKSIDVAHEKL